MFIFETLCLLHDSSTKIVVGTFCIRAINKRSNVFVIQNEWEKEAQQQSKDRFEKSLLFLLHIPTRAVHEK